jgi:ATP-dependent RNA helicase DeaD
MQVAEAVHKYSKLTPLTVVPLYGGAPMDHQIRALTRGVDIVVATPGRALDHMRRGTLKLETVEVVVLDEADEMLDMGFAEDLEAILTATPASRQTALFAATMAPRIAAIAERHLSSPARVTIRGEKRAAGKLPRVRQVAYVVSRPQKAAALGRVLEFEEPTSAIVFCRTRLEVDELTDTLKSHGYGAQAIHGGMEQRQRDRVMQQFRQQKSDILVATDVAARGLDIDHVSHVFNFDIPTAAEVYVHRIGRTGRVGRDGVAITLVDPREQRLLRQFEALTKQKIDVALLPTADALRAKRLDTTREALKTRMAAGDLAHTRALVEALAQEFELMDIAAAAVAMLHDERDGARAAADVALPSESAPDETTAGPMTTLFVGAGRKAGIRPGDLVGAIAGEARISAKQIGNIRIADTHALVEVPEVVADRVIEALRGTTLRGKSVQVRRDRDAEPVKPRGSHRFVRNRRP